MQDHERKADIAALIRLQDSLEGAAQGFVPNTNRCGGALFEG